MNNVPHKALFSLRRVCCEYRGHGLAAPVPALIDISLDIPPGEFLAVAGANASGKTSLALTLAGILRPTSGDLLLHGRRPGEGEHPFPGVAMLFQNPENTFVAPTLEEDIAFGPENRCLPAAAVRRLVDESLERVGLLPLARRPPATLSGGQSQLAAMAGAMACAPGILIMDEATAYLDARHRRLVLSLAREMNRAGVTVVMITQETEELWLADRLIVFGKGRLLWQGPPEEILLKADESRLLGLDTDPLVVLADRLRQRGLAVPPGRPTPDSLEEFLAHRIA